MELDVVRGDCRRFQTRAFFLGGGASRWPPTRARQRVFLQRQVEPATPAGGAWEGTRLAAKNADLSAKDGATTWGPFSALFNRLPARLVECQCQRGGASWWYGTAHSEALKELWHPPRACPPHQPAGVSSPIGSSGSRGAAGCPGDASFSRRYAGQAATLALTLGSPAQPSTCCAHLCLC